MFVGGRYYLGEWWGGRMHGEGKIMEGDGRVVREGYWEDGVYVGDKEVKINDDLNEKV